MKRLLIAAVALTALISSADAACRQIGNSVFCDDGTTYNRIGNSLFGSNRNTGTTWSQTTIGNSTFGRDSDGNSWSAQHFGNTSIYTDSDGNRQTCSRIGSYTTCY
jgi:hypothetical protein